MHMSRPTGGSVEDGEGKAGHGVGVAPPNGGQVHTDRWPHGGLGTLSPK